ncbi:MAG: Holliday junction branch migration protein RuvA [Trueperaceae bacterium]
MIAFVEGTVEEVGADRLVVRAGAFGVEVLATPRALASTRVGAIVRLATHLVVREDGWTLYGFADADGRALFRHLLGVGGVGPKLALAILTALTPAQVALAVASGDAALLATAPGVGKRTAERLVVELKGKLPESLEGGSARTVPVPSGAAEDAVAALMALGYREGQVRGVVAELAGAAPDVGPEVLIRKSLARLR